MAQRIQPGDVADAGGRVDVVGLRDDLHSLRQGTRVRFESDWIMVPTGHTRDVQHGLDDIPELVTLQASVNSDGAIPISAPSGVTAAATSTYVRLSNTSGTNHYVRARAS